MRYTNVNDIEVQAATADDVDMALGTYEPDPVDDDRRLVLNHTAGDDSESWVLVGNADGVRALADRLLVEVRCLDNDQHFKIAHRHLTKGIRGFFRAEWANEHDGGTSPSTLTSAIDSLHQGGLTVFTMLTPEDVLSLLYIRDLLPGSTRLDDITPDDGSTD